MKKCFFAVLLLTTSFAVSAYEPITHQELSREALTKSVLANPNFLATLGLQPKALNDNGYNLFPTSEGGKQSILEVIKFGADWEDGRGEKIQSTRHFFNPLNGEALSAGPYILPTFPYYISRISGIRSPDWALEDVTYDAGNLGLPQRFSYRFGRQYFYDALTLSAKADRDNKWGLTFQTLGHVIHHIQDMAQPQHTRNDFHCDNLYCEGTGLLGGVKPSFEKWTLNNENTRQYSGYEPVYTKEATNGFKKPRDFWIGGGKGVAEFSNRNFFTAGTNVGVAGFPSPQVTTGSAQKIDVAIICDDAVQSGRIACPANLRGNMTFFATNVSDNLRTNQSGSNPRATSRSIFDVDLKKRFLGLEAYSVNRFTYDATNDFTLKRAVGYSAGMINYFFRGEIDMVANPEIANGYRIKNRGTEPMNGRFALYYDDKEGKRQLVRDVSGKEMVWKTREIQGGPIEAGQSMDIVAEFTAPADAEVQDEYTLVFDGDIGEEKATGNNVGAVTAKRLKAVPYQGTLYLAGLDAANNLIMLKVDSTGTSEVAASGSHPLYYAVEGFYNPRTNITSYSGMSGARGHLTRQVEFVEGLNGMRYRTRAVSLRRSGFWAYTYGGAYSYVQGVDVNGASTLVAADSISWVAYSSDKAIGSFKFRLRYETGDITYVRSVEMADKSVIQSSGSVALPAGISASHLHYVAQNGHLIISPDGLRIGEFETATSASYGDWVSGGTNSVVSYQTLVINLAAEPTMTKEISHTATNASTTKHPKPLCSQCVEESSKFVERFAIGYFAGESRFSTETSVGTHLVGGSGGLSTGGRCTHGDSTQFDTGQVETKTELGGDSFSNTYSEIPKSKNFHRISDYCVDAYGTVISSSQSITYQSDVEDPYNKGKRSRVFPNHRLADSIYSVDGHGAYFRGISLLGGAIYDASPIGEVFIATPDMQVVIHEPVAGGMKKIVIPSNIVKLLAATWL